MRLKITLRADDHGRLAVPIHYQSLLQGLIYHSLEKDRTLQTFLHDEGFAYQNRRFKLFTFSRLLGPFYFDRKSGELIFKDKVDWYVGSILPDFINALGEKFLLTGVVQMGKQKAVIEGLEYEKMMEPADSATISMLSPITIYSTYEKEDGGHLTHYFRPDDAVFSHLLIKNSIKKYEAFYGDPYNGSMSFAPLHVSEKDKVVTNYRKTIINAWGGTYKLSADPKMVNFLYSVGLGSKNSQGFGMFKLKETEGG